MALVKIDYGSHIQAFISGIFIFFDKGAFKKGKKLDC
jgi:hypothetical protein